MDSEKSRIEIPGESIATNAGNGMLPDNDLCTLLFSLLKKGINIRQVFAAGYESPDAAHGTKKDLPDTRTRGLECQCRSGLGKCARL